MITNGNGSVTSIDLDHLEKAVGHYQFLYSYKRVVSLFQIRILSATK